MHDAKCRELKIGDIVLIPARIAELQGWEGYCNVTVDTVFGRRPDGAKEKIHAINTGVMLLASAEPDVIGPVIGDAPAALPKIGD